MATIEIYSADYCSYCRRAKALLAARGLEFTEYDIVREPARRAEMIGRGIRTRTIPQIFIDGEPIGGCDELHALDRSGRLEELVAAQLRMPALHERGGDIDRLEAFTRNRSALWLPCVVARVPLRVDAREIPQRMHVAAKVAAPRAGECMKSERQTLAEREPALQRV